MADRLKAENAKLKDDNARLQRQLEQAGIKGLELLGYVQALMGELKSRETEIAVLEAEIAVLEAALAETEQARTRLLVRVQLLSRLGQVIRIPHCRH